MFPVSHDGGAAHRRLYDCDFKLCILHVTGTNIKINCAGKYAADIFKL